MTIWESRKRPTQRVEDVLNGLLNIEDEDPSIQSACRLQIYKGAVEILALETKESRVRALNRIPALIRPHVKMEAMRIYEMRKK